MQLIALGSSVRLDNIGDPPDVVRQAVDRIGQRIGGLVSISRLYGTTAWPDPTQPSFVNAAILLNTALSPADLLAELLAIEIEFGRKRGEPNAPRTLDLDLIVDGQAIVDTQTLTLPHPRMHQRAFVLEPMCNIWPDWEHPILKQSARTLLSNLTAQPSYNQNDIWVLPS